MGLRHDLGRWGEEIAARYLGERGWSIIERNVRFGALEIDLVVERAGVVAFVEVKTRSTGRGDPLEAVGASKRRQVRRAAATWIRSRKSHAHTFRFDVVGVSPNPPRAPRVVHIPDAWRA